MHFLTFLNARVLAVVCVVTCVVVTLAAGHNMPVEAPDRVCYHSNHNRPGDGGYCGSALITAVRTVCQFNSQGKRSTDMIGTLSKAPVALEKRDAMRFLAKRDAFSDIICECCYNRCSISELQEYC